MKISNLLSDDAVLGELAARLTRCRIDRAWTQAQLAERAGVSKRTVERLEAGESSQLTSLIRILRVLELLPGLENLVPAVEPSPMVLLGMLRDKRKPLQRVRRSHKTESPDTPWSWGDEP